MGQGFFWPESPQKRDEYFLVKRRRPAEAQSIYQCRPGAREGSIFIDTDFAYYEPPDGLIQGNGIIHQPIRDFISRGYQVATGWDTAFEAKNTADWTVGYAGLLLPCDKYHCDEDPNVIGPCDPHFDVLILDETRDRLQWAQLAARFREFHKKWEPEIHNVEKKGSGITLYQTMPLIGINVKGVQAVESKRARAIAGVGVGSVQGWFRMHRVLFPQGAPWVPACKIEMKDFSGTEDAVDDRVDAIVHLVTYAILLGSNCALMPSDWTPDRVNENMGIGSYGGVETAAFGSPDLANAAGAIAYLGMLPSMSADIFAETCSRCHHYSKPPWCPILKTQVTALDCCEQFREKSPK